MLARRNNDWMTQLWNEFFNGNPARSLATAPAVNVKENEKAYTLEMAVPGLKKEYARVELDNDGNLHVKVENKFEHKEEDNKREERYLRREFSYGNYEQTYILPDDVDKAKIAARVANGVLTVELPKTEVEAKPNTRNIEIA